MYYCDVTSKTGCSSTFCHGQVAAGGLSGALMLVCVYPLEVVRTRLTSNQARHKKDAAFKGVWDCMSKTVQKV